MVKKKIGIIGYGHLGRALHRLIIEGPDANLSVAFVHDHARAQLETVQHCPILDDLRDLPETGCDLVVETAHPDVTRLWAAKILKSTHYMPVSLTALADAALLETLEETARTAGTNLYVPHAGVVGIDALLENRERWESVEIFMTKPATHVDLGAARAADIREETVLYDGACRGICARFPRNVNSHAAIALASIGFDRTRSVLRVTPAGGAATLTVRAGGPGIDLHVSRTEDMIGVSGLSTAAAIYNSVATIASHRPGLHLR